MSFDKKDTLKIGKNEIATIKLEGNEPFKSGQNTFDGKVSNWHGYNVVKGGIEYTYFASDSVHSLIKEAQPRGEFTLELRTVNNKEGQLRSVWYLNGKNIYQFQEQNTIQPKENLDTQVTPSIESAPDFEASPGSIDSPQVKQSDVNDKQKIIDDYVVQIEINLTNAMDILKKLKTESDVPF